MKKLITLMLGMTLLFGTVATVFGQEAPKKDTTSTTKKKKGGKKKAEPTKTTGGSSN